MSKATQYLLEECRMVLPGIQALFGFQLIAVFNERFGETLSVAEQIVHLSAIGLVALAIALVMAPAAYHRQTTPRQVSDRFVRLSSKLLLWSMFPLAIGISLDFYLIALLILRQTLLSVALALLLLSVFLLLWLVLPRLRGQQRG